MTSPPPPSQVLADLIATTEVVLLDFDGPVCSVFAGYPAPVIAQQLRAELAQHGDLTDEEGAETDPMGVLRASTRFPEPATALIDDALQRAEAEAIRTAQPTEGADTFLAACATASLRVFVVTNNTTSVAWEYLFEHHLDHQVVDVFGRPRDPRLMKPHPLLLTRALQVAGALDPARALMIGDSESDIAAAQTAGVPSVGFANKPGKRKRLAGAGATVIVTSMGQLAEAVD